MGAYCLHKPLKGNKLFPWRILKAKLRLTNVHFAGDFGIIISWQKCLMRGAREHNQATGADIPLVGWFISKCAGRWHRACLKNGGYELRMAIMAAPGSRQVGS